jgi:putative transposase
MPGHLTNLLCHSIWSTKCREPRISPDWQDRLYGYIGGILSSKKCVLVCAGGMADHIHLLVLVHPLVSVSELVNVVKSNSSKWVHETFEDQWEFAWQEGYAAFSVSCSVSERVEEYIKNQSTHHAKRTFQEELVEFLKKHGVQYDEQYL